MTDKPSVLMPTCPNCGSSELVGGQGYWFCTTCGWDELDGSSVDA